jgi:hypothetical protein
MTEAGEVAGDVGPQGEHAVFREAFQARGGGTPGVDFARGKSQGDEFLFETGSGENGVDALEKGALLAVVKRAINARKCWTKGGWIGEGDDSSNLDLVS